MSIYLNAIALQFYKGIGPEMQYVAPFSEMNFFIGANNSGKSIILNFISQHLPFREGVAVSTSMGSNADIHRGSTTGNYMAAVGVPATVTASRLEQKLQKAPIGRTNYLETVKEILSRLSLNDHLWIAPNNRTDADDFLHRPDIEDAATWVNKHAWRELWSALTRKERGELNKYWIPETLTHIAN
ncbi:ATP-binding protein [Rhodovulum sulfidophilum]|uniref:ATP-binding protein n=1 Tax=Rhodovulum sulfidophilum TaxID=35806 RepID=UPI001F1C4C3C|nr:ATP-binding protein [Rhodovulum sulfidophilum]MCE8442413.1 ATP-binding protein [Rhodovulum sulfidophilum]